MFYRSIYALWGFHPLPFRIAAMALLCVDFALLAVVVRQLTGSRWAVLVALMLIGINPTFSAAYFETGIVYDLLAYTFFWGAFALYVHMRRAGRVPRMLGGSFCVFSYLRWTPRRFRYRYPWPWRPPSHSPCCARVRYRGRERRARLGQDVAQGGVLRTLREPRVL